MKKLYVGIDLHSNNNVIGMLNQDNKRVFSKRLPNMPDVILSELVPYKDEITGIVVESTFNWYWLVDLLMDNGYKLHLANPVAMQKYSGLKYTDDKHDAFWLAHLLKLKILPEGYIYPKAYRPVRDLLRKRMQLVNQRSSVITSLQAILYRNCGTRLSTAKIKAKTQDHVADALPDQDELQFCGAVSKQTINFLTQQIESIEKRVEESIWEKSRYHYLKTIPGVGVTLAQTILLETGEISRFKSVGDFTSYCRKVPTKWTSNTRTKGKGNRKNGNKYLSWAFSEAAEIARRFDDRVRSYYARKVARTNRMVAHATLAHKFARAAYFLMRDNVEFDHDKLFA